MSTRRTSRRMAYRLRNPKLKTKARKRIRRRRNQSYPPPFIPAVVAYLESMGVVEPSDALVGEVARLLSTTEPSLESAVDYDSLVFQLESVLEDEEIQMEYDEELEKILDKYSVEVSEESAVVEESESDIGSIDLEGTGSTIFTAVPPTGESKSSPPLGSPFSVPSEEPSEPQPEPFREKEKRKTSTKQAEASTMKDTYVLTPYDELRLVRFQGRSKKVQTELGLLFFYLELRKRTLPLPSVAAFDVAMRANTAVLPKGFPIGDYYSEEYRQNAFVVYRTENGNTQLFIPSVNPITVESARRIPATRAKRKKLPKHWSPSLELISRPDLSSYREAPFPQKVKDVLKDKSLGIPKAKVDAARIGSPNPVNPNSVASWYQMIHHYIGVDTVDTPFRQKNKSGKFRAYNILLFTMTGNSLNLIEYFESPMPSFRGFLPPKFGSTQKNPRRKKTKKALPKKTKLRLYKTKEKHSSGLPVYRPVGEKAKRGKYGLEGRYYVWDDVQMMACGRPYRDEYGTFDGEPSYPIYDYEIVKVNTRRRLVKKNPKRKVRKIAIVRKRR